MWKIITIILVLYLIAIVLSFINEVTYKKRSPGDVIKDSKKIIIKTSLIFLIFILASIIYFALKRNV